MMFINFKSVMVKRLSFGRIYFPLQTISLFGVITFFSSNTVAVSGFISDPIGNTFLRLIASLDIAMISMVSGSAMINASLSFTSDSYCFILYFGSVVLLSKILFLMTGLPPAIRMAPPDPVAGLALFS